MKTFRLFVMALLSVLLFVGFTSCSKDEIVPDTEHPDGIPSNIPNKIPTNTIYYITSDGIIVRFKNEDFGGAKIVSNTYSSTKGYGTIEFASEVTAIEANAFMGKEVLTYIALPNSVMSIGDKAFYECSGLTSVTIPNSVTSIGNYAFRGCSGLTSVTIPNSVTSIGWGAFFDCSGLTSVTIPNSVTSIGKDAFYWCSGLKSVHISDIAAWCNIEFGGNPFTYVHHLYLNGKKVKDLVIPNGVMSIGNWAFASCEGLTSVTIPNSMTSIGSSAFWGCESLTSVHISDIAAWCNIEFGTGDSNPLSYAHHLYLNGEEVKDLVIPNSVTSIGSWAFSGFSGLTSVTIGNSVEIIGSGAFEDCSALTSVTIPNSVTSIGYKAFSDCDGLTSVTIGNSVTSIEQYAFSDCDGLKNVYCHAKNVPDAYTDYYHAFYNSNYKNTTLHVPAGSIENYESTYPWSDFRIIVALN